LKSIREKKNNARAGMGRRDRDSARAGKWGANIFLVFSASGGGRD